MIRMAENTNTVFLVVGIVSLVIGCGAGYFWGVSQAPESPRNLTVEERLFLELLYRDADLEIDDPDSMIFEIPFEGFEYWIIMQEYEILGMNRLVYSIWRVEK